MASTIVPFHRRPLWRVRRTARSLKRTGPAILRLVASLKSFLQPRPQAPSGLTAPRRIAPTVERVAFLDRRVHDPTRRALLTALSACERADLPFLRTVTGFPEENLSAHLWKLEKEGLAEIEGGFVRLSGEGRQAIEYWEGGIV
ncbi:MAG TPA: hypothetical protein VJ725_08215 [Thermoanaerobaculia bacterium]|nr:hypothetical protein [Thermoanaerobaculia bacterium]